EQLDGVIGHRAEYEAAREQAESLSGEFAVLTRTLTEGLEEQLEREDRTLAEMAGGITQLDAALPAYSRALERCLVIGRLLAWLVAAIAGLHGSSLIVAGLPPRGMAGPARPGVVSGAADTT